MDNGSSPEARAPKPDDISRIIDLVRACEPDLSVYDFYYYWMIVHYFKDTCAVVEKGQVLIGWCSIIPVSVGRYFLHQIGIRPEHRNQGVANRLLSYLVSKLNNGESTFEVELTIMRGSEASLNFFTDIADLAGMHLFKKSDDKHVLVRECGEELYVMRF